jgi:hypothetical protein
MTRTCRNVGRVLIISITGLIAACSSQHATYVADGRRGYVITCGGILNNYGNCLVQAGRACGRGGYEIVEGGPDDRNLLVACKAP